MVTGLGLRAGPPDTQAWESLGSRRSVAAAAAVPAFVALIHILIVYPHFTDDAYITFRYASNLAHGHGLVLNPGHRVEAISDPLWAALLAVPVLLHLPLPLTSWVLGALCLVATVWLTGRLVTSLCGHWLAGLCAGLMLALSPNFVRAHTNLLETGLFTLLLTVCLSELVTQPSRRWLFIASAMALAITRPEGLVLAPLLAGCFVAVRMRRNASTTLTRGGVVASASAVLVWVVAVELARRAFYGQWLPVSVIAKSDQGYRVLSVIHHSFRPGWQYVRTYVGWPIVVLLCIVAVIAVFRVPRPKLVPFAVFGVIGAFGLATAILGKGDWMQYGRLLVPYFPVAVSALILGTWYLLPSARTITLARRTLPVGAMTAVVVGVLWLTMLPATTRVRLLPHRVDQPQQSRFYEIAAAFRGQPFTDFRAEVGRALRTVATKQDLVATATLGQLSYYSGAMRYTDLDGLSEPGVAKTHERGSVYGKRNLPYTASLRPDVIISNTSDVVRRLTELTGDSYLGLVGPLSVGRMFIAVRVDRAGPIGAALTGRLGGRMVPIGVAARAWRQPNTPLPT